MQGSEDDIEVHYHLVSDTKLGSKVYYNDVIANENSRKGYVAYSMSCE